VHSRGEDADRAPEITRCAADLWMNHEEQAAAVDSQPWKRNTSKRDIAEINRWRLSRDAFSGS
jgi:hypothetical protein